MRKDWLSDYYRHLEADTTLRGGQFKPGTMTLITQGFSVAIQAAMRAWRPEGISAKKRKADLAKLLGKSAAQRGQGRSGGPARGDGTAKIGRGNCGRTWFFQPTL